MTKRVALNRKLVSALLIPLAAVACVDGSDGTPSGFETAGASAGGQQSAAGAAQGGAPSAGQPGSAGAPSSGAGAPSNGAGAAGAPSNNGGTGNVGAGGSSTGAPSAGSSAGGSESSTADGTGVPETTPTGYGAATTGGGNAKAVSVKTFAEVQAAVDAYSGSGGLVLEYSGQFDFSTIKDPCVQHTLPAQTVEIKGKSEITILGTDGSAANFGFHVAGASSNIIFRNLTIGLTPGGDASDIISIEGISSGMPKNVWIDHNELFTSMAVCAGAGDTAFDGMIDVKKGAEGITVSYNYLHDHHKVSLNGFTDDDAAVRHITFHHNLFENIGSRGPLQRHGFSHVFNNYFLKVSASGINVRMGGYSLVEANYFETVRDPVTARDSDAIGFWDLRANNLATAADVAPGNRFGISWDAGSAGTVNATAWTTTAAYPEALGYTYHADPFQCIHDGLRAAVGAGKGLMTLKCK